jgi:hypothetical protein
VPAELAGSIFEPFRQGQPSSAATPGKQGKKKGVGIGLSLVARFAQLHGGRAWVAERPGGGASFHVLLPGCVKRAEGVASPAAGSGEASGGARAGAAVKLDTGDGQAVPEVDLERLPRP